MIKTYSNPSARRTYAEALGIEMDAANSGDRIAAVKAAILKIKAEAMERGGQCPLRRIAKGKKAGGSIPPWKRVERLAAECFKGPRSEQWLWDMLDEMGIVISGGTPRTGPLTATMSKK
jgi:hypothetical protein